MRIVKAMFVINSSKYQAEQEAGQVFTGEPEKKRKKADKDGLLAHLTCEEFMA